MEDEPEDGAAAEKKPEVVVAVEAPADPTATATTPGAPVPAADATPEQPKVNRKLLSLLFIAT